jgi:hypothetical protein
LAVALLLLLVIRTILSRWRRTRLLSIILTAVLLRWTRWRCSIRCSTVIWNFVTLLVSARICVRVVVCEACRSRSLVRLLVLLVVVGVLRCFPTALSRLAVSRLFSSTIRAQIALRLTHAKDILHISGTAMGVEMRVCTTYVVVSSLDTLRAEKSVKIMATTWTRASPVLDDCKHALLNLAVRVTDCRVMESAKHIVENFIFRYIWMVEGVDDTRSDILQYTSSNLTSGLIQDVAEVILGEQRVRRISAR